MKELIPIIESYNVEEEHLYSKPYLYIKGYANGRKLIHVPIALSLARQIHDGQYRKNHNANAERIPYVFHVLTVASTLISLSLPISIEEEDILLCAALLHDALEDNPDFFKYDGEELVTQYGLPREVLTIVKLLSKRAGSNEYELNEYFNAIKKNKLALLIKMSDRSHNVEDLYVMKMEKIRKYIKETRDYIYPLASYAKANYPELSNGVTILKAKIVSLTEQTEVFLDKHEEIIKDIQKEHKAEKKQIVSEYETKIKQLEDENNVLRNSLANLKDYDGSDEDIVVEATIVE